MGKELRAGEGIENVELEEVAEEFVTPQQSVETTPERSVDQQNSKPGSAGGSYKEWSYKEWKEKKRRSAGQSVEEEQSKLL